MHPIFRRDFFKHFKFKTFFSPDLYENRLIQNKQSNKSEVLFSQNEKFQKNKIHSIMSEFIKFNVCGGS